MREPEWQPTLLGGTSEEIDTHESSHATVGQKEEMLTSHSNEVQRNVPHPDTHRTRDAEKVWCHAVGHEQRILDEEPPS